VPGAALLERVTRPWGATLAFLLLAVLVNAPYLFGGFQADDVIFLEVLARDPLPYPRWKGLWACTDVAAFDSMWWMDPGALGSFWRPLPSLLFEGSVRLLGPVAFPLHLASLLLHGGIAASLVLLCRRLGMAPLLAALAGLLFLLCEDHSMGVGWIATITDLMCVQLCMLGLLAHQRWLRGRRWGWLLASMLSVALGMACKESGVVAPLILVATTGLLPRGVLGTGGLWQRLRAGTADLASWLPQLLMVPAYLGFYAWAGMGGMDNLMYLDPMAHPGAYGLRLFTHLPPLWLASLTPMMTSLVFFEPALRAPLAVAGALCFAAFLVVIWPLRRHPLLPWSLGLYLLTLLPQLGADATERALYLPTVFLAPLLALLSAQLAPIARRLWPERPLAPRLTRLGAGWTLGVILAVGAALSVAYPWMFLPSLQAPEREARTAAAIIQERRPERVAVLSTSGMMVTLYTADMLAYTSGHELDVTLLSSGHGVWTVERLGERSLRLRSDRPGWLSNMFALMVRREPQLSLDRRYETSLFTVTPEELSADGTDLLAARFDFAIDLDDPGLLLLRWGEEGFQRVDPAELPVGQAVALTDNADIWASM
jgi:hypothetical protein